MADKGKSKPDPVRVSVVQALGMIESRKLSSDEAILTVFENGQFSSLDKRFVRLLVNGTVKMKQRLDHDIRFFLSRPSEKLPGSLRNILRLGFFQLFFTDRIPAAAAVSTSVDLAHYFCDESRARLVNAVMRTALRKPERIVFRDKEEDPIGYLADYYSFPSWLVKHCLDEFRFDETARMLESMNLPPMISFRVNQLKTRPMRITSKMKKAELKFHRGQYLYDFYHMDESGLPLEEELVEKGYIYIQDESAGMAVQLMDPGEGMKILDMAAAPGGKALYAAQLMKNSGMITAIDKSRPRLEMLVGNAQRLGVENIIPVLADATEFKGGPFNRVLLDVPCSGWGNAGKHSDLRWAKEKEDIERLYKLQCKMIDKAARLVKKDGLLVYSTCTIIRQENDQVVEEFLLRNSAFELVSAENRFDNRIVSERGFLKTYPNKGRLSGAFAAVLKKIKS